MIERKRGLFEGRNKSSAYKDLVFTVATSPNTELGTEGRTRLALEVISKNLEELGSDKTQDSICASLHRPCARKASYGSRVVRMDRQ